MKGHRGPARRSPRIGTMKTRAAVAVAACAIGLAVPAANAADAAPVPARAASASPPSATTIEEIEVGRAGEPNVKRTVIDDGRARIEELRVRGQLQKVTVSPKGGAPEYEVLTQTDGTRVFVSETGQSPGSSGKRVWKVLRF